MSEKKRRWFQIHLSTAIVMMFVAGGIMWPNLIPRHRAWYNPMPDGMDGEGYDWSKYHQEFQHAMERDELWVIGWPIIIYSRPVDPNEKNRWVRLDYFASIGGNIFAGLALLALTATVGEWHIRRREARKP